MDENVLPDDYPIYGGYFYLLDGRVVRSAYHDITVAKFKRYTGAKEVRRCDAVERGFFDATPERTAK